MIAVLHAVAIIVAVLPALAMAPITHYVAPVSMPLLWMAGARSGRPGRAVYAALTVVTAAATLGMGVWGFTGCASHPAMSFWALPVAVAVGVAMVLTSRRGATLVAFRPYAAVLLALAAFVVAGLLRYNPGSNDYVSIGC